jgi:hypothetical protein
VTPPLQLTEGALVVSPTQLAVMQLCPTFYKNNYLYRRVAAGTFAARDGGSAMDSALNHRYRMLGSQPATPEVEDVMLAEIDTGFAGLDLPLDEYRTPTRYKEVVQAYNAHYVGEEHEVLGVQVEFEVALGEVQVDDQFWQRQHKDCSHIWGRLDVRGFRPCILCDACHVRDDYIYWQKPVAVRLRGICDRIVRMPTGHVRVVDTKTANKFNGWAEFKNSGQLKAYCWALPRWFATQPDPKWTGVSRVDGAMIDLIVIKPPYKGGETRKPRSGDTPRTEFLRMEFNYSEERLEEWRLGALALVEQALGWVARDHFPMHERNCSHHFGKPCPYIDACVEPVANREMILGSDLFMDYKRDDEAEEGEAQNNVENVVDKL